MHQLRRATYETLIASDQISLCESDVIVKVPLKTMSSDEPADVVCSSSSLQLYSHRSPGLRAAVLGANDGLITIASLLLGLEAGTGDLPTLRALRLLTALAGIAAGAVSMALGEYVSVYAQRDTERGDTVRTRRAFTASTLSDDPNGFERELQQCYLQQGFSESLSNQMAAHVHRHVSLDKRVAMHLQAVLGLDFDEAKESSRTSPFQAAWVSASCFTVGGLPPFLVAAFCADTGVFYSILILIVATFSLAVLGGLGAWLGGASLARGIIRVVMGGWLAMATTFGVGAVFHVVV